MSLADRTPPTAEEFYGYRERFHNWGRWGEDDQLGTLNHITPEVRTHALTVPHAGRTVSCSYDWATRPGRLNPQPAQQYTQVGVAGSVEYVGVSYHGHATTHIDALCHVFAMPEQMMYNGRPGSLVRSHGGARVNSVHALRDGVVTRGILYDIPRLRGADFVSIDEPVHGWDLEDAARAQGVVPLAGDAVIIRCGRDDFYRAHPDVEPLEAAGVHASILEFLYEYDAALLGWDLLDAGGQGYAGTIPMGGGRMMSAPVHEIAIPHMGMPLIDNTNCEELSEACAELERYEFLFVVAPLAIRGGTGSPVNPIAIL